MQQKKSHALNYLLIRLTKPILKSNEIKSENNSPFKLLVNNIILVYNNSI